LAQEPVDGRGFHVTDQTEPGLAQPSAPTRGARRRPRVRDPLAAILIVLSVLWIALAVGSPLTGRTTFESSTILSTFSPWRGVVANDPVATQYCTSDTIDAVQPGRKLAVEDLRKGQLATIDPYQVGGSSSVLSQDTGLFNPVAFVPFMTLPLRIAPAYEKVLELLVVLIGMVLWVRRLGMSTVAGLVGGFAFGMSGFMVTWTNWPQTSVACWIPMLFWVTERLAQRRTLSSALLVALPFAAMVLGGFPAVTGWSMYAAVAYLLMRLLAQPARVRALVQGGLLGGLGLALGGGITAFMLLPFVDDYAGRSFGYRSTYGEATLDHGAVVTSLFPNALGGCGLGRGVGWLLDRGDVESNMFVGSAAAVLIVVALTGRLRAGVPNGPRIFFTLCALFLANQMLLRDPLEHAVAQLPVFDSSPPGRLRAVFGIATALLVAMGVDRIAARAWRPLWWRRPQTALVAAAWLAAAAAAAYTGYKVHKIDNVHHVGPALLHGITDALLVAAVTAVVVLLAAAVPRAREVSILAVAIIVAVQGAAYARGFWPRDPNSSYYPQSPAQALLDRDLGSSWRAAGDDGALRSGTSTFYGYSSPAGHSFIQPEWLDLLKGVDPTVAATATFLSLSLTAQSIQSPILDLMSVRYIVRSDDNLVLGGPTIAAPAGTGTVALSPTAPVTAPAGSVPLRAVGITFASPVSVANAPFAAVRVTLRNTAGAVVSSGTRRIYGDLPAKTVLQVAVSDTGPATALTAQVSLVNDGNATSLQTAAGQAALTRMTRPADGLSIVLSDDAVVYERTAAQPHVRWASTVRQVPPAQQVATLAAASPAGEVVVAPGAPGSGSGRPAGVRVHTDDATTVSADVDAQGAGYLVVSNSNLPGWSATVDGRQTPIVDADHGLQAVPVPAGEHRVELEYDQKGVNAGIALTLVTLVVYAVLWGVVARRRARLRRRGRRAAGAGAATQPGADRG
jgi:hypothetical protein